MSFLPMLSGAMGGGGKDSAKPDANAALMQQMVLAQQKQIAEQQASAKRTQTYIFAGLGVAAFGTILFLLLKK
jgi:hypothetical protein